MRQPGLTERLRSCIERHIACYEGILAEYETLEQDLSQSDLQEMGRRQRAHGQEIAVLEKEFYSLLGEWRSVTDVEDEDRAAVADAAARAEELARRLQDRQQAGIVVAQERLAALRRCLADVRQGRDTLRRYGAGDAPQAGYIDRKA